MYIPSFREPKARKSFPYQQILKYYIRSTERKRLNTFNQYSDLLVLHKCINLINEICNKYRLSENVKNMIISTCLKLLKKHYRINDYRKSIMLKSTYLPKFVVYLSFCQNPICFSNPKRYFVKSGKYKGKPYYKLKEFSVSKMRLWNYLKISRHTRNRSTLADLIQFKNELNIK